MKTTTVAGFALPLLAGAAGFATQETSAVKMPEPVKEHGWLQQLVGDWEYDVQIFMESDKPPMQSHGVENVRAIGGFWTVAESHGTFMNEPFAGLLTLGFDPEKEKYIGTWIGSMSSHLWQYEGSLDEACKILTLESEGPCPGSGNLQRFREVMDIKSSNHRVYTSSMQGEDGQWSTAMIIDYRRKQ